VSKPTTFGPANRPVRLSYHARGRIALASALSTGRNYTKKTIAPLVHKDIRSVSPLGSPTATPAASGRPLSRAVPRIFGGIRVPTLVGCLATLAAGRQILVVDVARYMGGPATIIVLRAPKNRGLLYVTIVKISCSAASPAVIAKLTIPAG